MKQSGGVLGEDGVDAPRLGSPSIKRQDGPPSLASAGRWRNRLGGKAGQARWTGRCSPGHQGEA